MNRRFDIVVVGAGLGGLSAALRAAEVGRSTILIEAGGRVGGTAAFSGVHIWGAHSWEEYRRLCPLADPALARALFDGFQPYVGWLLSTGAPGAFETTALRGLSLEKYQIGRSLAPRDRLAWFDTMHRRLEGLGGVTLLNARATCLIVRDGVVCGVTVDGVAGDIACGAVILAAGGFQGDAAMLSRHAGPAEYVQRAVATNRGDGLRLALAVGAATTPDMDTLYGHLMPAAPCRIDWTDHLDPLLLTAFYAQHGIIINAEGRRFVDEGDGELTGVTINAACRQPPGGLWIVMDEAIRRDHAVYQIPFALMRRGRMRDIGLLRYVGLRRGSAGLEATIDSLRLAADRGAVVINAPTLDGLAERLGQQGVAPAALLETLTGFNRAVEAGAAAALDIPKTKSVFPITTPPYWAIKVGVGVSMTYGGVAIDTRARALNPEGRPVPGLYAVPGTAGGVHRLHYAGALAACGVYGMIAADSANAALNA
jgi:succinate dehydrogenase/fumarate reductase flavoprotein subunit